MILAGSDVSGNTRGNGQIRHIAFVLGTEESINGLHNDIGIENIHMDDLRQHQRRQVINRLEFTRNDIQAWCFNVERQNTIDFIYQHEKLKPKNKLKSIVQKHFDYLLLKQIKGLLTNFIYFHNGSLSSLVVECDGDMSITIGNWKMKKKLKGKAYELADAVAWCNAKGRRIKQCPEPDYIGFLRQQMEYDLLKR